MNEQLLDLQVELLSYPLSLSRVGSFMSFLPVYFLFCRQTIFQCELHLLLPLLIVPFPVSGCDDILN